MVPWALGKPMNAYTWILVSPISWDKGMFPWNLSIIP